MKRLVIDVKRDDGKEPTADNLDGALDMIAQGIERNSFGGFGRNGDGCGYRWTMTDVEENVGTEGGK